MPDENLTDPARDGKLSSLARVLERILPVGCHHSDVLLGLLVRDTEGADVSGELLPAVLAAVEAHPSVRWHPSLAALAPYLPEAESPSDPSEPVEPWLVAMREHVADLCARVATHREAQAVVLDGQSVLAALPEGMRAIDHPAAPIEPVRSGLFNEPVVSLAPKCGRKKR